jgi:hypothetical protein
VTPERLEELRARVHRDGLELIAEIERPTVRQLEWKQDRAYTIHAVYSIYDCDCYWSCDVNDAPFPDTFQTINDARAACQAHYEAAIRAGLLLAKGE